jgi:hypothetical protein
VPLTHASLLHMTTREVIVMMTPKSKRRDVALRHYVERNVGSESEAAQVPRGHAPASGRMAVASRINPGANMPRDSRWRSTRLNLKIDSFQVKRGISGLRQKRTRLRRRKEPTEAPCKPMRLRQFRGLVSWE